MLLPARLSRLRKKIKKEIKYYFIKSKIQKKRKKEKKELEKERLNRIQIEMKPKLVTMEKCNQKELQIKNATKSDCENDCVQNTKDEHNLNNNNIRILKPIEVTINKSSTKSVPFYMIESLFEKKFLQPDYYQSKVLVECLDKDYVLLQAEAGAGKTSFVPMWVYAQNKINKIKENDIVCLSMTNVAKDTINKKLYDYGLTNVCCKTIHSYFADIYEQIFYQRPKFANPDDFLVFIENYLSGENCFEYYNGYIKSISMEDYEILDWGERERLLKQGKIISFKGERLKSYGELYISSWLTLHGIEYVYERDYPYGDFKYNPDFYIPSLDLWIEFFGIDKNGNVAPGFSTRNGIDAATKYKLDIEKKKRTHLEYDTKLLDLYLWEKNDGSLENKLNETFKDIIKPVTNIKQIWENETKQKIGIITMSKFLHQNALFMESRGLTPSIIKEIAMHKNPDLYGERVALANISYKLLMEYINYQNKLGYITFSSLSEILQKKIDKGIDIELPKYIFIDECQDIPFVYLQLLEKLKNKGVKFVFSGDERQGIFDFAGCITYQELKGAFNNLYFCNLPKGKRVPKNVMKIANSFIEKDKGLNTKGGTSVCENDGDIIVLGGDYPQETSIIIDKTMKEEKIKNPNAKILFQGRENETIEWLIKYCKVKVKRIVGEKYLEVIFPNGIVAHFNTFHSSKGMEYDVVYILESNSNGEVFPGTHRLSAIHSLFLPKTTVQNPIERKLFYTALTRTKGNVYIVSPSLVRGKFTKELINDYYVKEIYE